ncbi:hypothetical protein D9B85_15395, partial [Corynebacterium diphtheriae]
FKNAGQVQQRLYASISLNSNPFVYRDPFQAQQGIQKISLENYNFKNAGQVQQRLYASISLNSNPFVYRDPFQAQQG